MSEWGRGYITDVEYSDGFYREQVPVYMALPATLAGFEPPESSGHFTYCELGCGRGTTALVLAAINPEAEFHAVDFNPAHVAHARDRARRIGLRNLTFHERSFEDLARPGDAGLPMFDLVSLHGVWTWIAPALQRAIVEFIDARLNPGGGVYISFNALPAWTQGAPLQRLIRELAATTPQRSDLAVAQAIARLDKFLDAKVVPERFAFAAGRFKDADRMLPYFAHEYLNEHWQPAYFADVARALAGAKLNFAACSDLVKNFHTLLLNAEQRALIAELPSMELRETLKDFCTENWFRQDIFVRGARRTSERRRAELLEAKTLALMRSPPETFEFSKPDGTRWRPDPAVYGAALGALKKRPHTVSELLRLDGLPRDHQVGSVELVGMLVGTGLAGLFSEPTAAQSAAAERFNAAYEAEGPVPFEKGAVLAVPGAYVGMPLSAPSYALYDCLRRGESPDAESLAAGFVERCRAQGAHPVIDDQTFEDPSEAFAAVTRDYEKKIASLVPIWKTLRMV